MFFFFFFCGFVFLLSLCESAMGRIRNANGGFRCGG